MIEFADLNYREVKNIFSNNFNLDKKIFNESQSSLEILLQKRIL